MFFIGFLGRVEKVKNQRASWPPWGDNHLMYTRTLWFSFTPVVTKYLPKSLDLNPSIGM